MIAGTIAELEESSRDPLESWNRDGHLPALDVRNSQKDLEGGSIAQSGVAGGRVNQPRAEVGVTHEGKVWVERDPVPTDVHTEWVADVTGAGIIAAESVHGSGEFAFPFDLFMSRTNTRIHRLEFDLDTIATHWDTQDRLHKKWMVGSDHGDGVSIDYHEDADQTPTEEANVGLGFLVQYEGTVAKGVLYKSGYLAVWEDWTPAMYCRFISDELLEHANRLDDTDGGSGEQTTLDAVSGGDN